MKLDLDIPKLNPDNRFSNVSTAGFWYLDQRRESPWAPWSPPRAPHPLHQRSPHPATPPYTIEMIQCAVTSKIIDLFLFSNFLQPAVLYLQYFASKNKSCYSSGSGTVQLNTQPKVKVSWIRNDLFLVRLREKWSDPNNFKHVRKC